MKCKCPSCGVKFKIKTKVSKNFTPDTGNALIPKPARLPGVKLNKVPTPKLYRINTDVGAFRQALYDAGFVEESDKIIFNDKNKDNRRLKLWFGRNVFLAPADQKRKLVNALTKYFGDRLIETNASNTKGSPMGRTYSYIVRLKL